MTQKFKTARAIEDNEGVVRKGIKKLAKLRRDFQTCILDEIYQHLDSQGMLAMDDSLSNPQDTRPSMPGINAQTEAAEMERYVSAEQRRQQEKARRRQLEELRRKVLRDINRNPDAVREDIEGFVARNIRRWTDKYSAETRSLCDWIVRNTMAETSRGQKDALKAAGFSDDILKARWTVPLTKKQYISPKAAKKVDKLIEENAALITKINTQDIARISDVVAQGLTGGDDYSKLRRTLADTDGFDAARVERVVRDQTHKASMTVQTANAEAVGITEGVWCHVPGKYTSRRTHMAMHGKKFRLGEGLYDSDVDDYVVPGQLPFCRCIFRTVLPKLIS